MYYLGYDLGSSSIKVALVESSTGKSVGVVTYPEQEMEIIATHQGWAEQDPDLWWDYLCEATSRLLRESNVSPESIQGIGIAYQMHGLVLVDTEGKPLRPSIIWCDSRAVGIGNQAYQDLGEDFCAAHFLNAPGNFTASKLKWVADHEPELFAKVYKFMLPGDYMAYKLSGQFQTTISGLSEGIFWDFKNESLADSLMKYYGIDSKMVPEIVPTIGLQSKLSAAGAKAVGLVEGTPIFYRAGDQPNNALSLNVLKPGEVAATGGTSGVVYAVTDQLSVQECSKVNNFAHVNYTPENNHIGKLLCINGSGILYRWMKDNLDVDSYEQMNQLAESVAIGSEGLSILPFGNGAERMLENINLGAHIEGLQLNSHHKSHLCRAALEGIAFSFVYGMELMQNDGVNLSMIKAGDDNLFRSQIFSETIATLMGVEIKIFHTTGAIGAARACSLVNGDMTSFSALIEENDYKMTYLPKDNTEAFKSAYTLWKKRLEQKLKEE